MSDQGRSSDSVQPDSSSRRRRIVIGVIAALLVAVTLLIGPGAFAAWARWMSARQTNIGAISEAQRWLTWSARLDARSGETELMQAACFRRLGQMSRWDSALRLAREKGANPDRVRRERMFGLIRQGVYAAPESRSSHSNGFGLLSHEVDAVSVRGHLARNEPEKAKAILDSWTGDSPHDAYLAYMCGVYRYAQGDETKAVTGFEAALARQPQLELALSAMAKLLEKQNRLTEAINEYVRFATRCPRNQTAKVGLARVLRKLGRLDEARGVVEPLASSPDQLSEAWAEMGLIELELGNYAEAQHWLAQALVVDGATKWELLSDAATGLALQGEVLVAGRMFAQVVIQESAVARTVDLDARLAVSANKKEAAEEYQRLSATLTDAATKGRLIQNEHLSATERENAELSPADLYAFYCSACHGMNGDGNGLAARHLFPKPRNLRSGRSRLVSTRNGNPTLEDIAIVIQRGMPGTSMRSFDNLNENQVQSLAREVLRLGREGIRERFVDRLNEEDEEMDEKDVQEIVRVHTVPGDVIRVPPISPSDPDTVARGRDLYFQCGCRSCHGDDGTGVRDIALVDENRQPSPPRDLVHEPFKGGHEWESVYLRILAGMPGSPHPATRGLTREQFVALVHYCRSLSREPKRTLTNHQRFLQATNPPAASSRNDSGSGPK